MEGDRQRVRRTCSMGLYLLTTKREVNGTDIRPHVPQQRRNDDNFAEILDLSAPTSRLADLRGWHLERMAVGEFDAATGTASSEYSAIKQKSRPIKRTLRKILANAQKHQAKRDVFVTAMVKQRDALLVELEDAKEFLSQVHLLAAQNDPKTIEYSLPAPVEQRFLQAAKKTAEPSAEEKENAEEEPNLPPAN